MIDFRAHQVHLDPIYYLILWHHHRLADLRIGLAGHGLEDIINPTHMPMDDQDDPLQYGHSSEELRAPRPVIRGECQCMPLMMRIYVLHLELRFIQ